MHLQILDDVIFRVLADEAVILNLTTGTYFGLDSVGTRIWQLIAEHGSTGKVIEAMLAEYEVEEARLHQDVDDLVQQLISKGLVKAAAEETAQAG